jgi:hypothetical protein
MGHKLERTCKIVTSVENIIEDVLGCSIIEGWNASHKLKQAHTQCPPVHCRPCITQKATYHLVIQDFKIQGAGSQILNWGYSLFPRNTGFHILQYYTAAN